VGNCKILSINKNSRRISRFVHPFFVEADGAADAVADIEAASPGDSQAAGVDEQVRILRTVIE